MDPASLLLIVMLIGVFYLLLIRPQQKQRRQLAQIQQELMPGAKVMTGSGLIGTVRSIEGDEVELEVAPGVTNRFVRRAIVQVFPEETPDAGNPEEPSPGIIYNESNADHNPSSEQDDSSNGNAR